MTDGKRWLAGVDSVSLDHMVKDAASSSRQSRVSAPPHNAILAKEVDQFGQSGSGSTSSISTLHSVRKADFCTVYRIAITVLQALINVFRASNVSAWQDLTLSRTTTEMPRM